MDYCRCHYRRNIDESIRSLERDFQQTPTQENQLLVNIARMRAGLLPLPRIYHYNEGWTAQTILPDERIFSSATVSHDGWWGISHATWIKGAKFEEIFDLGDHFVREYPDRSWGKAAIAKPTQEEVGRAHQQVVEYLLGQDIQKAMSEKKYYRWSWLKNSST